MTGSGYLSTSNRHPVSLGLAVALTGAGLTALLLVEPIVQHILPDVPRVAEEIAITMAPPPKPIESPKPAPLSPSEPAPNLSHPVIGSPLGTLGEKSGFEGLDPGSVEIIPIAPVIPPEPVLADAMPDSRFLKELQPPYPPSLQRLEIEGTATVRVQIDADGRVVRIESVAADNEGFLTATRGWALRHWRFKPATRDGVAVASWKTMTVRFQINR